MVPYEPTRPGVSQRAVNTLVRADRCPICIGELDTGYECIECGYDAISLIQRATPEEANGR